MSRRFISISRCIHVTIVLILEGGRVFLRQVALSPVKQVAQERHDVAPPGPGVGEVGNHKLDQLFSECIDEVGAGCALFLIYNLEGEPKRLVHGMRLLLNPSGKLLPGRKPLINNLAGHLLGTLREK